MKKSTQEVTIIARITIKKTGQVLYKVRSCSSDAEYCVVMLDGHAIQCDCPSRKPCKHMKRCTQFEANRNYAKNQKHQDAQQQPVTAETTQDTTPARAGAASAIVARSQDEKFQSLMQERYGNRMSSAESTLSRSFLLRGQTERSRGGWLAGAGRSR